MPAARPSSTVVLVRDAPQAPEILLVRRHARSAFGGAYAFPGGVVDRTDADAFEYCNGLHDDAASRLLAVNESGLKYYVAAIRELFEETGVLLAEHRHVQETIDRQRCELNAAVIDWQSFLLKNDVSLTCDALHYFSHWITPDAVRKRYSTRFFVARMPEQQIVRHDGAELTDATWLTAAAAVQAAEIGRMSIHFPTMKTLEQLATHEDADAIVRWADAEASHGVEAIHPVMSAGVPQIRRLPRQHR